MNKIFSIAIDGPAGAGKSTIAKAAAAALGATYLDTGAMYRTVGLHFVRSGLIDKPDEMARLVGEVDIGVKFVDGKQHMLLDGEDVTLAIRTEEASKAASGVAAIPEVRERLVPLQREAAKNNSIVMDGRDIATKVLPDATLKLYITADVQVRALRRYNELRQKGVAVLFHQVLDDMVERDYNDSHREASPLEIASDAVVLDTTRMNQKQVLDEVVRLVNEAIGG